MKKLILSAFVVAGLLFTSCDKSDDNTSEETNVLVPMKISGGDDTDKDITEFSYDTQNRLSRVVESSESKNEQETYIYKTIYTFQYEGNDLVKVIEEENNSYNGNESTSSTIYTITKAANKINLNYTSVQNGQTYSGSEVLTVNENGFLLADEDYTYSYDSKGNMVKYVSGSEQSTFEYDDKNGILKNVKTQQWALEYFYEMSVNYVNNAVKYTYEDADFPEDNETQNLTYQYNSAGYPISTNNGSGYSTSIQYNK